MLFEWWQWALGALAAVMVGMSKTGVPGLGILVVTLLAAAFKGWGSIGIMLPMLIVADLFAVAWYRRHAQWPTLITLFPWVLAGLLLGGGALMYFAQNATTKAQLNPVIGVLVLSMLALHLLSLKFGERLTPRSPAGTAASGLLAGFSTVVSNAAGSIMSIYMAAHRLDKHAFVGTLAWYFFLVNLTKVPIYAAFGLFTRDSLLLDLCLVPGILAGAFAGKWLLPRLPRTLFDGAVLALAALGALQLLLEPVMARLLGQ